MKEEKWVNITIGQIWKECDNRFERYVRVVGFYELGNIGERVLLRTVYLTGEEVPNRPKITKASFDRFHGKHGGYKFVR